MLVRSPKVVSGLGLKVSVNAGFSEGLGFRV